MTSRIPDKLGGFSISKGRRKKRGRYVFYGPGSVGKTTLALSAPGALVMSMEDGDREFDVARYVFDDKTERVYPTSLEEVKKALHSLLTAPDLGGIETLVVDGFHELDRLSQSQACAEGKWSNIAEPGYGKGERATMDVFRPVWALLDSINSQRNLRIIVTGHDNVANFKNPEGAEYGHFDLMGTKNAQVSIPGLVYGKVDVYGFMRFEPLTAVEGKKDKARVVSVGEQGARMMYLRKTTAWVAKCRYGGPPAVELTRPDGEPKTWADIFAELETKEAEPLRQEIERLLVRADRDLREKVRGWVRHAGEDVGVLSRMLEGLKVQLGTTTNEEKEGEAA